MAAPSDRIPGWQDLLRHSGGGDHLVQVYQDEGFLADAVAEYAGAGLRAGEAVIFIVTPGHRDLFLARLKQSGPNPEEALRLGQLVTLDAAQTLASLMPHGKLDWSEFQHVVGGALAELRCQYPAVRAYGEMVDLLWQEGRRDTAAELEGYWNSLGALQTFSLFCAYHLDALDPSAYGGPLESVCKSHTHLIPARNYSALNEAVSEASKAVLDQPLAQMLNSLSGSQRPPAQMPSGQATLFWLKRNMPRTADKVLARVRAELS